MIDAAHRFRGYNSLRFVYQRGETVRSASIALRFKRNTRRTTFRAAVVVSRKVSKSAVVRNRIRRRIFEVLREANRKHPIITPYDFVFLVYSDQLATIPAAELQQTILELFEKAAILPSQPSA